MKPIIELRCKKHRRYSKKSMPRWFLKVMFSFTNGRINVSETSMYLSHPY